MFFSKSVKRNSYQAASRASKAQSRFMELRFDIRQGYLVGQEANNEVTAYKRLYSEYISNIEYLEELLAS